MRGAAALRSHATSPLRVAIAGRSIRVQDHAASGSVESYRAGATKGAGKDPQAQGKEEEESPIADVDCSSSDPKVVEGCMRELSAAATFLMGCLPTYAQIGALAPLLLVLLRFIQGFAVGGAPFATERSAASSTTS